MPRNDPLVIPGATPDDDLLDVNAAAAMLGVAVGTLRSHQYQDENHAAREPWPQPENPDTVEIELPGGTGYEWARAIEELLIRSGGAGRPVRLWRRSKLQAFLEAKWPVAMDESASIPPTTPPGDQESLTAQAIPVNLGPGTRQIDTAEAVIRRGGTVEVTASMTIEKLTAPPKRLTARELLDRARARREREAEADGR